jgi:hypothetical protein
MLYLRAISRATSTQEPLKFHGRHGSRGLERGLIVTLKSEASCRNAPGLMPYVATKHADLGIAKNAGEAQDTCKNRARTLNGIVIKDSATRYGSTW